MSLAEAYDSVPYDSKPFHQSHPDRLATVATLFGLTPPPVETCRVLELGAASGGNLLPMASAIPGGRFVGIDLSERQIAEGQRIAAALQLDNVELRHLSIMDVDESLGEFDYIICHGVYSWVPAEVQAKILEICRWRLRPNGVAYISYNTYPGWHVRGMIRDMMLFHTQGITGPADRVRSARALLEFLLQAAPPEHTAYTALLQRESAALARSSDGYIFHEQLAEFNEPLYFHQFVERLQGAGLQYLGEAAVPMMTPHHLAENVVEILYQLSPDLVHLQQYLDFVRAGQFRMSLICRPEASITRTPAEEAAERFYLAAPIACRAPVEQLRTPEPVEFYGPNGDLQVGHPVLKAALHHLGELWPRAATFDELAESVSEFLGSFSEDDRKLLAGGLLKIYLNSYAIEFHVFVPPFVTTLSDRPLATRLSRFHAECGPQVVNQWHRVVALGEVGRQLLRRLDGTRGRAALVNEMVELAASDELPPEHRPPTRDGDELRRLVESSIDAHLGNLARCAVLVG